MKADKEIRILAQLLEAKTELQEQALSRTGASKRMCLAEIKGIDRDLKIVKKEMEKMNANEYQKATLRTASKNGSYELILNGVLGLSGETGEVADHVKKYLFQGHNLNKHHLAEELGDICWYLAITAEGLGYDLGAIMQMNIDKLMKRYPNGFEKERSLHRKDDE